ncbi:hypothetical protein KHC33_03805 [Methanospirillum sp. J.3.6.1-F.2.7.3]|uniref:Pentapeptide repeat-containing protein n=1 Tax=Methanospirillum purgamenti TaxID=2834276 RepID=A0A8E7EKL4_9EURY|nr:MULTISPECIES: pentapeptide repeat-containing protein [Methanospirillum]MDX8551931.1 pentapeptide repeat-containing protein [Methanospirillum hungatei]QVV89655.1 hypothetical protein KHC33_03805 [Methanospirillum sp. J.3.6.1-F.2.7.3]
MCEYIFRNGEKCSEPSILNSQYCIFHYENSEYHDSLIKLQNLKIYEKIINRDFNFEGAKIYNFSFICLNFVNCNFNDAVFYNDVSFEGASFEGETNFFKTIFKFKSSFKYCKYIGISHFHEISFFDNVDFNFATFNDKVKFISTFFNYAEFSNTIFYNQIFLEDCKFKTIIINNTIFYEFISFFSSSFEEECYFNDITFNKYTNFGKCTFNSSVFFLKTFFKGYTEFRKSRFNKNVHFSDSYWFDKISLSDSKLSEDSFSEFSMQNVVFLNGIELQRIEFNGETSLINFKSLIDVDFSDCIFNGELILCNITVKRSLIFTNVCFCNLLSFFKSGSESKRNILDISNLMFNFSKFYKDLKLSNYIFTKSSCISFIGSEFFSDLIIDNSKFLGDLNLNQISIKGKFSFHNVEIQKNSEKENFHRAARLYYQELGQNFDADEHFYQEMKARRVKTNEILLNNNRVLYENKDSGRFRLNQVKLKTKNFGSIILEQLFLYGTSSRGVILAFLFIGLIFGGIFFYFESLNSCILSQDSSLINNSLIYSYTNILGIDYSSLNQYPLLSIILTIIERIIGLLFFSILTVIIARRYMRT